MRAGHRAGRLEGGAGAVGGAWALPGAGGADKARSVGGKST